MTLPKLLFGIVVTLEEVTRPSYMQLIALLDENSEARAQLQTVLFKGKVTIKYLDYDWSANSI